MTLRSELSPNECGPLLSGVQCLGNCSTLGCLLHFSAEAHWMTLPCKVRPLPFPKITQIGTWGDNSVLKMLTAQEKRMRTSLEFGSQHPWKHCLCMVACMQVCHS